MKKLKISKLSKQFGPDQAQRASSLIELDIASANGCQDPNCDHRHDSNPNQGLVLGCVCGSATTIVMMKFRRLAVFCVGCRKLAYVIKVAET